MAQPAPQTVPASVPLATAAPVLATNPATAPSTGSFSVSSLFPPLPSNIIIPNVINNSNNTNQYMSLNEEFYNLYREYNKCIDDINTTDVSMKLCIEKCFMLKKRVSSANLISSNEEIDDINTEILKFGLLPHFLSELYTIRNGGIRSQSLNASDSFGKTFINACDNWTILSNKYRNIFDNGFGKNQKNKLNPFQQRTQDVSNFKIQKKIKNKINKLLKKNTLNNNQNKDNKWQLFNDEDDEREFWLNQYQIAILKTLKTLKQNAFERPLTERYEKEQQLKNVQNKYSSSNVSVDNMNAPNLNINHKAQLFQWKPQNQNSLNGNNGVNNATNKGKGPKIWSVDADGKTTTYNNLDHMKYCVDNNIDNKIAARTDRSLIFRDPNPWTYTPEQAAQLGLLNEIPKDYWKKKKDKERQELLNKKHIARYGKPLGYNIDNDDGSELNPGKIEYHRKGKVTTFTMNDVPKDPNDPDDKDPNDMTDDEYNKWLKEERGWANWKDDHEKGAGNPYYH